MRKKKIAMQQISEQEIETDEEFLEKMYLKNCTPLTKKEKKAEKLNRIWYKVTKGLSILLGKILK